MAIFDFFTGFSLKVECNRPFSGSIVPLEYYNKDKRVSSIMIELNRSLYMNEATGDRTCRYDCIKEIIERFLYKMADCF